MTTTTDLVTLTVQALTGKTNAGANVFNPRDWPTWDGTYPVVLVSAPKEDGESLGRNAPQFTVTTSMHIEARLQAGATDSDASATSLLGSLQDMREQVKQAVINYPPLMSVLQQYPYYRSNIMTDPSGDQHLGQMVLEIGMEFYQGPEDFYPINPVPLNEIDLHVDSVNIFDPNGTYTNPPFPEAVTPAPRTQGPDGRDEGYLVIDTSSTAKKEKS